MKNMPDFGVRKLSEYPVKELENLLAACKDAIQTAGRTYEQFPDIKELPKIQKNLDVWTYRIRDAMKQASKK